MARTKPLRRKGRTLKIPPAHLAAMATGAVARTAYQGVKRALKRNAMKALAGGAAAGAAYTGYRGMAATQKRATAQAGVKRVRTDDIVPKRLFKTLKPKRMVVPGTEWQVVKTSYGHKIPMSVKRLSKVTTQRRIYRFQNIAPIDRTNATSDRGAYWLNTIAVNTLSIPWSLSAGTAGSYAIQPVDEAQKGSLTSPDTYLGCPVHMYLLNGTRDRVSLGAPVAYRPFIKNDVNGNIVWEHLWGTFPDESAAGGLSLTRNWQKEYSSSDFGGLVSDEKVRYIQNDWYDIKLCLRNATSQRTYYDVQIVSFADDWLDPLGTPGEEDQVRERHALWYGIARKSMNHPLQTDKNYASVKKKVLVHKSMRVYMDSNLTTQVDAAPNLKIVKLFYRDGTLNDYARSPMVDVVKTTTADQLLNPNVYEQVGITQLQYESIPKPRARKWLMITAFDPTVSATASAINPVDTGSWTVNTNNPSYDIIIRKKETRFPDLTS